MTKAKDDHDAKHNAADEGGGRRARRTRPADTPEVADPGPLPRVIKPIERAPEGTTRYKVRVENWGAGGAHPSRYILAKKGDEKSARELYLKETRIAEKVEREKAALKAAGMSDERLEPVRFVVVELPD